MDFLNELFGSEMGELKRHQKVILAFPAVVCKLPPITQFSNISSDSCIDWGRNQKVFYKRGLYRAEEGCTPAQERLWDSKNFCKQTLAPFLVPCFLTSLIFRSSIILTDTC